LVRIGGIASSTSASVRFVKPTPIHAIKNAISARLGTARPTFEALMARNPPRPWCPSHSPIGMAITHAMAIAAAESFRCGQVSSHICSRPPTCVPPAGDSRSEKMNSKASANWFTGSPPPSSTG
jgi:hypothetical protein